MSNTTITNAVNALTRAATSIAENSLSTGVVLGQQFVLSILKNERCLPAAISHVVAGLRAQQRPRLVSGETVAKPLELIFEMAGIPDAARKEKLLLRFFASGMTPTFIPVTVDEMVDGTDVMHIARAIADYGVYSVTVVTAPDDLNRYEAIYAALGELDIDVSDRSLLPRVVPIHRLEECVPIERRQFLVVDRGHRFGTAEHYMLLRAYVHGITYVGHLEFPTAHPGIGLRRLLDVGGGRWNDGIAYRASVEDILYSRLGDWVTTRVTTVAGFEHILFSRKEVVFAHPKRKMHLFVKEHKRRLHDAPIEYVHYRELKRSTGKTLVLEVEALAQVSLDDWLHILSGGWSPCVVVGGGADFVFSGRATIAEWIRGAPHRFKTLACDVVI